ncbi:toxic anion resistance protein [Marinicella meishanensis]|uniref:toxic anion resistance protein n=1 Tax=Marinicella meishanensis TaxID=2873263 RepID=UPI001CBB2DB8|nr:toxic anion resistance protein [Marinicella sp. NBU2979]
MTTDLATFKQLTALEPDLMAANADAYLQQKSQELVSWVASVDPDNHRLVTQVHDALAELGRHEQQAYWQLNHRLVQPLQQLMADTEAGGRVSSLLRQLQQQVADMQPPKQRLNWKERFLLLFSWRQTAFQMWLDRFAENQQALSGLMDRLQAEQKQLRRDNHILQDDLVALNQGLAALSGVFDFVAALEAQLKQSLSGQSMASLRALIQDEWLPPVQQRLIELQQQLLIARQGVMTLELIIQQNQSLIRDIDQTVMTTTAALDVAAAVATAKHQQQQAPKRQQSRIDPQQWQQAAATIQAAREHLSDLRQNSATAMNELNQSGQNKR